MTPAQFQLHAKIEDSHWWFVGRRYIIQSLVDSLFRSKHDKILIDMGCGTGGNLSTFRGEFDCTGIDLSSDAILLAKKRFPTINFICAGLEEEACVCIEKADVVLLLDVLEHIRNDMGFLFDLVGRLKKGSHLLITVPAEMALWSPHDDFHGHFRRYSKNDLFDMLIALPVSIRLLSYYNIWLYPAVKIIRSFTNLTGKAWGKAETDLSVPPKFINTILSLIFSSESRWLINRIDQHCVTKLPFGVSLIALVRKE